MTNSRNIAGLLGPTLVALTTSEAMNPHIWAAVPATQTYLAGALWLVAGLSIVRVHNRWSASWPVLVTLLGWFATLGGLGRMFFPEHVQQGTNQSGSTVLGLQLALVAIGLFLTFQGYRREVRPSPEGRPS